MKSSNFPFHHTCKHRRSHSDKHQWIDLPLVGETYYYKKKIATMFLLDTDRLFPLNTLKCDHHKIETNILCGFNNRAY